VPRNLSHPGRFHGIHRVLFGQEKEAAEKQVNAGSAFLSGKAQLKLLVIVRIFTIRQADASTPTSNLS
jgi:hypothetical protein